MKITDIRTLSLSRAHEAELQWYSATFHVAKADCSICIIDTDEDLQGISEPCAYGVPPDIAARIAELKPGLIGRDPRDEDLIPANEAERANDIANAGLNCALWDLRGKIAGVPTAELLCAPGHEPLRRLRLYASSGVRYDWDDHPESVVEEAISYAEEGFTAYKMRLGTHWAWSSVTVDRFLEIAHQVHAAVGDRMDLALDGNCRLSMEEAQPIASALDQMGWAWFEEPVDRVPADYARLNEAVSIPVTAGKRRSGSRGCGCNGNGRGCGGGCRHSLCRSRSSRRSLSNSSIRNISSGGVGVAAAAGIVARVVAVVAIVVVVEVVVVAAAVVEVVVAGVVDSGWLVVVLLVDR